MKVGDIVKVIDLGETYSPPIYSGVGKQFNLAQYRAKNEKCSFTLECWVKNKTPNSHLDWWEQDEVLEEAQHYNWKILDIQKSDFGTMMYILGSHSYILVCGEYAFELKK